MAIARSHTFELLYIVLVVSVVWIVRKDDKGVAVVLDKVAVVLGDDVLGRIDEFFAVRGQRQQWCGPKKEPGS